MKNEVLNDICGYKLDKKQKKAILCKKKSVLLIAGAGSGKTLTIIGKVRYLIETFKYSDRDILCITFTTEAVKNLKNKIENNYNYNIDIYTFHKIALEIMKDKKYLICDNNLLKYIVDEYFYCIIYNNIEMISGVKKYLNMMNFSYGYILKTKELKELKRIIITFINLFKTNKYSLSDFLWMKNNKLFISIIIDIYYLYETELSSTNTIDFNDMLIKAIEYIKYNKIKQYKYIIVDEYQDTSYIRYLFLLELVKKTGAKIFCVGDDYQSIYRFNGCNINIFLNFKNYFKPSKILIINNTYRNSQELINVASKFILKNKLQLYKKLRSNKHIEKPIKIYFGNDIKKVLDIMIKKYNEILILGRNNADINEYFTLKNNIIMYKNKPIRYMTVHSSKGLESEAVLIINLKNKITGFPSGLIDPKELIYVNNNKDLYPYEEERRLFYVAITRTKNEVYMLVDKKNPSIFIKEIIKENKKYIEYI